MRFLTLGAALTALFLAGCQTTGAPTKPRLSALDSALTRKCEDPQAIPSRRLDETDVVRLWGRDRIALTDCGRRHAAVVRIYSDRDRQIGAR